MHKRTHFPPVKPSNVGVHNLPLVVASLLPFLLFGGYVLINNASGEGGNGNSAKDIKVALVNEPVTLQVANKLSIGREQDLSVKSSAAKLDKLCFTRGEYIYLFDPLTKKSRRIVKGRFPSLSPTGKLIAFVQDGDSPNDGVRLKLFDLETNSLSEPSALAGLKGSHPRWSPDGSRLAFQILIQDRLHIGVLDMKNNVWDAVTKNVDMSKESGSNLDTWAYLSSWSPGSDSIICTTLHDVYEISLDGAVRRKIAHEQIIDSGVSGSGQTFSLSPDGRYLLFDAMMDYEDMGIYTFDLQKQTLTRITPVEIRAMDPQWLPSGEGILFIRLEDAPEGSENRTVYEINQMSIDGRNITPIIQGAQNFSYSKQ